MDVFVWLHPEIADRLQAGDHSVFLPPARPAARVWFDELIARHVLQSNARNWTEPRLRSRSLLAWATDPPPIEPPESTVKVTLDVKDYAVMAADYTTADSFLAPSGLRSIRSALADRGIDPGIVDEEFPFLSAPSWQMRTDSAEMVVASSDRDRLRELEIATLPVVQKYVSCATVLTLDVSSLSVPELLVSSESLLGIRGMRAPR